jgi:hypothetical protein
MTDWHVRMTSSNGTTGEFTISADEPDHRIVSEFGKFVCSFRENDPDPLAGIEIDAPLQPRRQARG